MLHSAWPSTLAALAVLAGASLSTPSAAFARGGSAYMRQVQQVQRQQAQATQKYMEAVRKQQEAEQKEFMERFDTNHNGKIDGKERGPVTRYLREKELGIDQDAKLQKQQQATMKLGKSKSSRSPKSSKP